MINRDTIRLSTGRELSAYLGLVSVSPDLRGIYEGKDGTLDHDDLAGEDRTLTTAERVELADLMIARWQAYRERWAAAHLPSCLACGQEANPPPAGALWLDIGHAPGCKRGP